MQFLKTMFAAVRGGITIRHAALIRAFGTRRLFALYGLFVVVAAFGTYNSVQNVRLEREVIKLTAERDLIAHELDATLDACTQVVIDEVLSLHEKFHKLETLQAAESRRLDDLTTQVGMSSPKPKDAIPYEIPAPSGAVENVSDIAVASVVLSPRRRWYYLWLR